MPVTRVDDDAMPEADEANFGKRLRDDHAEELTGYARALDALQRLLPRLRPDRKDSVAMGLAVNVLVEQWMTSAWHRAPSKFAQKPTQRKDIKAMQRSRVKNAVGDDVWSLIADASVDEVPALVEWRQSSHYPAPSMHTTGFQ